MLQSEVAGSKDSSDPALLKPPEIRTSRLLLRSFVKADVDALYDVLSRWQDITPMIGWAPVNSKTEADAFVQTMLDAEKSRDQMFWAVEVDGRLAGSVFFVRLDRRATGWNHPWGMLGYWMAGEYRNQGYATEATGEVMAYGFGELGLHKIKIGHVHVNDKSRRVIDKLGFRPVGVERQEYGWRDESPPVWFDHHLYELLASDWTPPPQRKSP